MRMNCCINIVLFVTKAKFSQHSCLAQLDVITIRVTQEDLLDGALTVISRHRDVELEFNWRLHRL